MGCKETRSCASVQLPAWSHHAPGALGLVGCVPCALHGSGVYNAMSNYLASPTLFERLASRDIFAVGTCRNDRTAGAASYLESLDRTLVERGDMNFCRSGEIAFVHWRDSKDVTLCSTISPHCTAERGGARARPGDRPLHTPSIQVSFDFHHKCRVRIFFSPFFTALCPSIVLVYSLQCRPMFSVKIPPGRMPSKPFVVGVSCTRSPPCLSFFSLVMPFIIINVFKVWYDCGMSLEYSLNVTLNC